MSLLNPLSPMDILTTSWTGTSSKSNESQKDATESVDPFVLRERLVFRENVPIDADSLILL